MKRSYELGGKRYTVGNRGPRNVRRGTDKPRHGTRYTPNLHRAGRREWRYHP